MASSPDVVSPWGVPSVPFDDLLAAAQKGDAGAFGALYRTFGPLVHRFFRVQQPAEAEDLTSEVFVSVAESLHRFAGDEAAFRGWVFTIAHRRLIDHRRRWARRQSHMQALWSRRAEAPGNVEDEAVAMLATGAALSLIAGLPPAQAEVLLLRVVADLSSEQIGRIVGRRSDAVRALQHRALRRLARQLNTETPTIR